LPGQGISRRTICIAVVVLLVLAGTGAGLFLTRDLPLIPGNADGGGGISARLTPDEQRWVADHPDITVCPDPDYPPFEYFDESGNYAGISADYLRLVGEKTGLTITAIHETDWRNCVRRIQENRTDILGTVFISDLRTGYLNYTAPYYQPPLVIITRRNVSGDVSLESLSGRTVAAVEGYTSYELLRQKYPGISLLPVPDIGAGLESVSFGTADAYFGDLATASWFVEKEGLSNLRVAGEYTPPDAGHFRFAIGVRSNEPELQEILDKGLADISPDERQQIADTWVSSSLRPSGIDPRIITGLLLGTCILVIIILLVFTWNRSLRRAVGEKTRELSEELEERRRVQESLRESGEKYRTILETIQDVFYRSDLDGNLIMISPSGAKLLGYDSPGDLIGLNVTQNFYVHPEDRTRLLTAVGQTGFIHDYEVDLMRKDGTVITVSTSSHFYPKPDGTPAGIEGIFRDISDRKRIEGELIKKNEELHTAFEELTVTEEELKEKYEELRKSEETLDFARKKLNILNTITFQDIESAVFTLAGYLELQKAQPDSGDAREFLEKEIAIVRNISNSLKFANYYQTLGLSRPRWQNVKETFLFGISHLDVSKIRRKLDVGGLEIYADPLLENVFFSLAENVLQHGGTATEIRLSYRLAGDRLVLVFEDNGKGIPEEMKEKIFERRVVMKKGLSLFLTREILGITGITIRETGTPGSGARFEMLVPEDAYRVVGQDAG